MSEKKSVSKIPRPSRPSRGSAPSSSYLGQISRDLDSLEFDGEISEKKLIEYLKENCEKQGTKYKEMHDSLNSSAAIFRKLSKLCKEKSPDKLSLIQSATLINAAIARGHFTKGEFMEKQQAFSDLNDLCSHILQVANAKKLDANLVEISDDVAKQIEIMRKTAFEDMKQLEPINYRYKKNSLEVKLDPTEVESLENIKINHMLIIQNRIAKAYTAIMKNIAQSCEDIMGDAPCKYTVVGMGSLARKEITPYSDFEHVIVLEEGVQHKDDYEAVLEYFRWFSVIFQIIVINLQETIIPSVGIQCLNNFYSDENDGDWFFDAFTKRGISFDGHMPKACKFPLGRMKETKDEPWTVELIQPISGMMAFLSPEQNLKNEYCLGDMLTKTCFVYGDLTVYQEFVDQVQATTNENRELNYTKMMKQLHIDLKNFDAYKNLHELRAVASWNIKRVIYRSSTLFISALGQLHSLNECSCFDIVAKLKEKSLIDDETEHRLLYAVAIACQVRLHIYIKKKSQDDNVVGDMVQDYETASLIDAIQQFLGNRSLVDYFEIVYALQKTISTTKLEPNRKLELKYDPITKFIILSLFNIFNHVLSEWEIHLKGNLSCVSTEDKSWILYYVARAYRKRGKYDKALIHYEEIIDQVSNPWLRGSLLIGRAQCLHDMRRYDDAITYIREHQHEIEEMDLMENQKKKHLCSLLNVHGYCLARLKRFEDALMVFKEVEEYIANDTSGMHDEIDKASTLANIGKCLLCLNNYDEGLQKAKQALNIYERSNASIGYKMNCERLLCLLSSDLSNEDGKQFRSLFHRSPVYAPYWYCKSLPSKVNDPKERYW